MPEHTTFIELWRAHSSSGVTMSRITDFEPTEETVLTQRVLAKVKASLEVLQTTHTNQPEGEFAANDPTIKVDPDERQSPLSALMEASQESPFNAHESSLTKKTLFIALLLLGLFLLGWIQSGNLNEFGSILDFIKDMR